MPEWTRQGIDRLAIGGLVMLLASSVHADFGSATLHEFVPPDVREDIALSTTTPDGALPAAIDTLSGVATAPDTNRQPGDSDRTYGGLSGVQSVNRIYTPDLDTRRPDVSHYDDPFSPATSPYKRLRAFDAVGEDFSLAVAESSPRSVLVGGAATPSEESFFAEMTVDLVPGDGVLIPTVGPGARIIKMLTVPPVGVRVAADSADNWYLLSSIRTRVRLVQWVAVSRETFGGPLPDVPISRLRRPPVPENVRRAGLDVARQIGVQTNGSLRQMVGDLVAWFRSFEASDELPHGKGNKYLDLALSRKGVCRHRSYAFMVTALSLGIPCRLVLNEAHAWVEVFDGSLWRRIDLGGAANRLELDTMDQRPQHRLPPDPYPWPANQDSGEQVAEAARSEQSSSGPGNRNNNRSGAQPAVRPNTDADEFGRLGDRTLASPSKLVIASVDTRVMRGSPLHIEGTVAGSQDRCAHVRIDVSLVSPTRQHAIGSLSTDEHGKFKGAVVMPLEVPVGDYELVLATPGGTECGAGRSEE